MTNHASPTDRLPHLMLAGILTLCAALVVALGSGSPAAAGGWAVGSLDALPDARAGATEQVGFTILQHGVTPRHFGDETTGDVGIEIIAADGGMEFFPAVPDETAGHYVAAVTFPQVGDYTWGIRMGWFPPQELGLLAVTADERSSTAAGWWGSVRWVLVAVAVTLSAIAARDLLAGRRRISHATA